MAILVVVVLVFYFFGKRIQHKRQQEDVLHSALVRDDADAE